MDFNSNSMELSDEDKRRESEWERVVGAMMANSCTRKKSEGTSLGGMGSEGRDGQEEDPKTGFP